MTCQTNATHLVSIVQGASLAIDITVQDTDATLLNLTTASVFFTVRHRIDDVARVIYKRSALAGGSSAEIDVRDQTLYPGMYRILLVPTDTRALRYDARYVWDTWIQLTDGGRYPVITAAPFQITPAITRF